MGSAFLQEGRFANAQESRIHFPKRSDMCSFDVKLLRFSDAQESRFQVWELSYMACAALQIGRFADCHK